MIPASPFPCRSTCTVCVQPPSARHTPSQDDARELSPSRNVAPQPSAISPPQKPKNPASKFPLTSASPAGDGVGVGMGVGTPTFSVAPSNEQVAGASHWCQAQRKTLTAPEGPTVPDISCVFHWPATFGKGSVRAGNDVPPVGSTAIQQVVLVDVW